MSAHHHHDHAHPLPPSGQATVMLDIGDGVGALVVHTPATLAGTEIEIRKPGETRQLTHTEVRERRLGDGSVYAGVFPAIVAGTYTLVGADGRPDREITIGDGTVTEITWQ
jgi:hypothetical protein